MKQLISAGACLISTALLVGCATSNANYAPPAQATTVSNSKTYPVPYDVAWDRLVKNLSADFFVINNIDKSSRLINVSFSSQKPSDFIDCGSSSRTFTNARGEQRFNYLTADSAQYIVTNGQGHAANVNRKTKLDGRINVYVAPEGDGTIVNVNTKYVLGVDIHVYPFAGGIVPPTNVTADFSTKSPYSGKDFSCYGKGNIESRVFSFLEQ